MMLYMEVPDGTVPTSPADLAEKVLERTEDFSACPLGCDNHFKGAKNFGKIIVYRRSEIPP